MSTETTANSRKAISEDFKGDESKLLSMLEEMEHKHGFIPRDISEELARMIEVRLERLTKIRGKIESTARRDVEEHLKRWADEEGNLIMILHAIQDEHGYVPREVAMELSRALGVKLARIYEVITFYHYFKLVPPGKHNVSVCMGTACYLKGGPKLVEELKRQLNVEEGETTDDRMFHLDVVRCIGCCGLAPAMTLDGKTYGKVMTSDISRILDETRRKDADQ